MREVSRYFRERIANMKAGAARSFTPPRATLQGRDQSIATTAEGKPEDNLLYTPFREAMVGVPPAEQEKLKTEAAQVIGEIVQPAYADLLQEVLPRRIRAGYADHDCGGSAAGRKKLLPAENPRVHHARSFGRRDSPDWLGREDREAACPDARRDAREAKFDGDFPHLLEFLATDPQFQAKTAQELLLSRAAWIAKVFDGKSSQYFGYLPRMRFTIKPVPDDLAPFYTSGRGGAGVYLLKSSDLPHRPLYNLPALTLHESAPGHAFQGPIALEHEDSPTSGGTDYISAYGEGWALYCEKLGVEMGMYETPYERFGMLGYQIWRACRLVVDTGVHSKGWTREQALEIHARLHRAAGARDRDRGRPLHRLARTGALLLPRRVRYRARPRESREGARAPSSTFALSTMPSSSSAECHCRFSPRASIASSPKAAKVRTRTWSPHGSRPLACRVWRQHDGRPVSICSTARSPLFSRSAGSFSKIQPTAPSDCDTKNVRDAV